MSDSRPSGASEIRAIEGRMVPLPGDDIDTDRIIPARFLRCVTFDGLEDHVFEDDRAQLEQTGAVHPFGDPRFRGASILLVRRNFGCGSSREHAPQAILRWGIRAIVGESFAEIFFGNCVALGLPCVTVARDAAERLAQRAEAEPQAAATVDIDALVVESGPERFPIRLAPGPRDAFLRGTWDATGQLLADYDQVEAVAARLPYVSGSW